MSFSALEGRRPAQMPGIKDHENRKEALRALKEQLLNRAQERIGLLESACIEELDCCQIQKNMRVLAEALLIRRLVETDRIKLPSDINRYLLFSEDRWLNSLI